jgi:hypothetical protein
LEESLIRAIVLDYDDLKASYDVIREQLEPLAASAVVEEQTAYHAIDVDGLADLHLDAEDAEEAAVTGDVTSSNPTSSQSGQTELTTPNSEAGDATELETAGEILLVEEADKVAYLQQMFTNCKKHTARFVLRQSGGDVARATDELFTRELLDAEGSLPKGVDGFFREDGQSPQGRTQTKVGADEAGSSSRPAKLPLAYALAPSGDSEELEGAEGVIKARARSQVASAGPSSRTTSPHPRSVAGSSLPTSPRVAQSAGSSKSDAPLGKRNPYEWQKVTHKHRQVDGAISRRKPDASDAHINAAEKRLIATDHYRAAVAAANRAGSDPLARQAVAVHLEKYRAASHIANQAAFASYEQLVDERSTASSIDLHHLPVQEGVSIAVARVKQWWDALPGENRAMKAKENRHGGFVVITGQGRHNRDGRSRLREEVYAALRREGWAMSKETGQFVVTGRVR